jgi:hypothetical protein
MLMAVKKILLLTAFSLGMALTGVVNGQQPFNQGFGAGYGGYGYQSQYSYGPIGGGYAQQSYFAPNAYQPNMYQAPPIAGPQGGYGIPPVVQNYNTYPVNVNLPNYGHHQHHHWHPGHYLMGHY